MLKQQQTEAYSPLQKMTRSVAKMQKRRKETHLQHSCMRPKETAEAMRKQQLCICDVARKKKCI